MCLAVPGQVVKLETAADGLPTARVVFGGVTQPVCISLVPDVQLGEYVLVHAGIAIQVIDAQQAQETLQLLAQIGEATP